MFFTSGHSGVLVNARGNIDRFRFSPVLELEVKDTINEVMSLITCGSIHEGHEWFSDYSRGRQEILCVWLFYYVSNFADNFANRGARISIKSYFSHESIFLLSQCIQHPGGGGIPVYGLYRYVPRNRVWFFRFLVLK